MERPAPHPPERQSPLTTGPRIPDPWSVFRASLAVLAAVGLALAAWWFIQQVQVVLSLVLISLLLSFALEPAVNWLAGHGWRRGPATIVVLLAGVVAVAGLFAAMVPLVVGQVQSLVTLVPTWIAGASELADRWFGVSIDVSEAIQGTSDLSGRVASLAGGLAGGALGIGSAVLEGLFASLSIALFTFYLTAEGPKLRRHLCSLLSAHRQREVLRAWELAIDKMGGFLYSRMLLAVISAVTAYAVLMLLGVPFPLALAIWLGLTSQFVPTIGTYIGAVLPLLTALTVSFGTALAFLVYALVYQQIENYLLAPRLTARAMALHPAVAFGSAIAGAAIAGLAGAFFALPVVAVAQAFVSNYLNRHPVVENHLTDTTPGDGEHHTTPDGVSDDDGHDRRTGNGTDGPHADGADGAVRVDGAVRADGAVRMDGADPAGTG